MTRFDRKKRIVRIITLQKRMQSIIDDDDMSEEAREIALDIFYMGGDLYEALLRDKKDKLR